MFDAAAVAEALAAFPQVRLAYLFGSRARTGVARSDSDLDVAVAAGEPLGTEQRRAIMDALALRMGVPIDLVDLRVAGMPLLQQILTKGQAVFCRDRTLLASLLERMWGEDADFMPYRQRILAERRRAWIGR